MTTPTTQPRKIGLTLSGGGFRATLFHLGVVRFLREAGLLKDVSHITSVSGGSILAAHLALNWERYTSEKEEEFSAAVAEVVEFVRSDLRGRIMRPWLASWVFPVPVLFPLPRWLFAARCGRTSLLQSGYNRLYRGATLGDLTRPGRPQLHILATSMTSGHMVAFGEGQVRFDDDYATGEVLARPLLQPEVQPRRLPAERVPVALAVAASSAFPGLFPPMPIDGATFGAPPETFSPRRHYLADGGVFDNLGIRKLLWVNREQNVSFDLTVVSDAQRGLTQDDHAEFSMIWSRGSRSIDLMMTRLSWFENESIGRLCDEAQSQLLFCRLGRQVSSNLPYALSGPEVFAIQNCRTDLDAFTRDEINAIVHYGYAVACAEYCERKAAGQVTIGAHPAEQPESMPPVWLPLPPRPEAGYGLTGTHRTKLGLWRRAHWASWALWGLLVAYVGTALAFFILPMIHARDAEKQMQQAEKKATEAEGMAIKAEEQKSEAEKEQKRLQSELERAAKEHAGKKILIVERLSDLASAETPEQWDRAEQVWNLLVEQLRKDPWFDWYLGEKNDGGLNQALADARKRAHATPPQPGERLQRMTLAIAKELGTYIRDMPEQDGSDSLLELQRKQWFAEAVDLTQRMVRPGTTSEQVPTSRRRFWSLYWGGLAMVEQKSVESAMVTFGGVLNDWTRSGGAPDNALKERLGSAAKQLKEACERELEKR